MRDNKGRFIKGIHYNQGRKHSLDFKKKISQSLKLDVGEHGRAWKGGFPKCIDCKKETSRRDYNRCKPCAAKLRMGKNHHNFGRPLMSKELNRKGGLRGAETLHKGNPTSIERAVYDFLLLKGILFERQKLINEKFLVDAYIPSLNLVIEADGKYWHNMDKVMKKDKAENAYLTKCGFNLIRLSEEEIKSGKFKERLVQ